MGVCNDTARFPHGDAKLQVLGYAGEWRGLLSDVLYESHSHCNVFKRVACP